MSVVRSVVFFSKVGLTQKAKWYVTVFIVPCSVAIDINAALSAASVVIWFSKAPVCVGQ